MSKKKIEEVEEEEVAPFWMISFSDLMTLLLSFFIILFSISTIEEKKMKDLMEAMGGRYLRGSTAFSRNKAIRDNPSLPRTNRPADHLGDQPTLPEEQAPVAVPTKPPVTPSADHQGGLPSATPSHETQRHTKTDHTIIPFALENSNLEDNDKKDLAKLAERWKGMSSSIIIKGHSSNKETSRSTVDDLAYERAWNVREYLLTRGLERKRFSLVIVGPNEPLDKEDTRFMQHLGDVNTYVEIIPENK